ncbi:TIR domain-containing protein [Carboxylicivirga sediminis]|uniref:TIR domain-containing protein n=1 Tax=Carboxylicivirga sediminis TaxID=2006564 RepID=A0A941IZY1_9BACT|nr:TIR domain-containing protein [Carboxylicivirga sediminis]MBR8537012.1 TIR domain-containing protein [Carboxylicivirga sediminis]
MARKCFYSFHYKPDNWRVSKIRNIGTVEGNKPAKDNDWETITGGGDKKIKEWISSQMIGRTCTIILTGSNTANRKWINHEIVESWNKGMGVLVIFIHKITDVLCRQSSKGSNPLYYVTHGPTGKRLSSIAKAYDPPRESSKGVYSYIAANIDDWIEEAIQIRKDN